MPDKKVAVFGSGFLGFVSEHEPSRIPSDPAVSQIVQKLHTKPAAQMLWPNHRTVLKSALRLMSPISNWVEINAHNQMLNRQALMFIRDVLLAMNGKDRSMSLFTRAEMFTPGFNDRNSFFVSEEARAAIFEPDLLKSIQLTDDAELLRTWVEKEGIVKVAETLYVLFGRSEDVKRLSPIIE